MKHKVLIVLIIGSLGHSAHTMQLQVSKGSNSPGCFGLFQRRQKQVTPQANANLELDLQKDADQLSKESIALMARIKRAIGGAQASPQTHNATHYVYQPQQPSEAQVDMNTIWVELFKTVGALQQLAKHNIRPTGASSEEMQTGFAAIDAAYKGYLQSQEANALLSLATLGAAIAQNNQNYSGGGGAISWLVSL